MSANTNETYFVVRDENGETYLCQLNCKSNQFFTQSFSLVFLLNIYSFQFD